MRIVQLLLFLFFSCKQRVAVIRGGIMLRSAICVCGLEWFGCSVQVHVCVCVCVL